jgi:hypothetical protein
LMENPIISTQNSWIHNNQLTLLQSVSKVSLLLQNSHNICSILQYHFIPLHFYDFSSQ